MPWPVSSELALPGRLPSPATTGEFGLHSQWPLTSPPVLPPAWLSWMGTREQTGELTPEIPEGGQGNTAPKWVVQAGGDVQRWGGRGEAAQRAHLPRCRTARQAGGWGHPDAATTRPEPKRSGRWLAEVTRTGAGTGMHRHTPSASSCSYLPSHRAQSVVG